MTNEERVKEILTTEVLARYLISYNDYNGVYYTSDGRAFYYRSDAINHEIEWLKRESNT
jgi:hypothetical protein